MLLIHKKDTLCFQFVRLSALVRANHQEQTLFQIIPATLSVTDKEITLNIPPYLMGCESTDCRWWWK